ncbi:hypothetical protein J2Y74_000649 [Pseudomonas migulae]|uniref:hypothetical protein n=1 Tax=Pseudomonas migulae TaxID=78543 RepID=UPI00209DA27F|nr:hypothetical protein [Pseudomonas migulae]MCP1516339.1 hypothetical protein [Pseudomonas migulae]
MKPSAKIPLIFILSLLSVGCATYKNTRVLEAEERVVIYSEKPKGTGANAETIKIMCPEPSPDALKTLAASASIEKQEVASLAAAYSEAAANIGLRTHTIQLLRDQLFSICQAYANEGITPTAYQMMLTRNQRNTVALMTIEQLTGVLRGPTATLGGSAAIGPNQKLKALNEKLKAEAEADYTKLSADEKAKPEGVALKKKIDEYTKAIDETEKAIVSATASAESKPDAGRQLDAASFGKVAEAVQQIASKVLEQDDSFYVCLDSYQTFKSAGLEMPPSLAAKCDLVFTTTKPAAVAPTPSQQ